MEARICRWIGRCMAIACLTALTFVHTSASSKETYRFERLWPVLQQPWYFHEPRGMVVDDSGNVYVADRWNHRVQKFTSDGQFVTAWGSFGSGDGDFSEPVDVDIDENGNVYVIERGNHRVQKLDSDGQFITSWGGNGSGDGKFTEPEGIALDSSGNVYVADTGNDRIQKFNSGGQFTSKWGSRGSDDKEFAQPQGIAVDDSGNVYVADTGNDRILKFTSSGQFIRKWGVRGSGDSEFNSPSGVVIYNNETLYVADKYNNRISKYTLNGQYVSKWSDFGSGDREFYGPVDISVDRKGNVYVAELSNNRIQKLTSDGGFISKWESQGSGKGEFDEPRGIAVDANSDVYVTDRWNSRIQKFSATGLYLTEWGSSGTGNGELLEPEGIAIDGNGDLYVVDSGNSRIQKFSVTGQYLTQWGNLGTGNGELAGPEGIAIDANNNVYVVDSGNNRIQKFTSKGQYITKWGSKGSDTTEFNHPTGIALDGNGNIYVADEYNYRIQKFSTTGQYLAEWGSYGRDDGEFINPNGIAIDSSGNVYVADSVNYRIQQFSTSGQFLAKWGEQGSSPGQLDLPSYLALTENGRLYVADTYNHRIQVFKPVTAVGKNKAIIVAGGGPFPGNNIWDATQMCANFAYRALTYQGYSKDTIYYLTADTDLDLDGNGILDDVDADATNTNLQDALTTWAQDAEDLFIYIVDHGGEGTFRMGATELLYARDLDAWLDDVQDTIPGGVTLLYDACRSGSFLPLLVPAPGKTRVIATSARQDEEAIFASRGTVSFSFLFWGHMFNGNSFYDSFVNATNSIGVTYPQNCLLEGNGNDEPDERTDQEAARALEIGNETRFVGGIPHIGSVSPAQKLEEGERSALIYAADVIDADGISRVWAVITPPGYSSDSPDDPVTDLPLLELASVGDNRYEAKYPAFTTEGTYSIAIYATDQGSVISLPRRTEVNVGDGGPDANGGDGGPDAYEVDDTYEQANIIVVEIEVDGEFSQLHNFHDNGDRDWVKFYGIDGEIYEIEVTNVGDNCDPVISLYDVDGTTLLEDQSSYLGGEDELLSWTCPQDGIYSVMIRQADSGVSGSNTDYDLNVYRPIGPFPGDITGTIRDGVSGDPIAGAVITTSQHGSAISLPTGGYRMGHPPGTFIVTASAVGYATEDFPGVIVPELGAVIQDFELMPREMPGDLRPVFRFWSDQNRSHFFTLNEAEKDSIIATYPDEVWRYERIAWFGYAPQDPPVGVKPVYRFWSDQNKGHFYTISGKEKENIIAKYPEHVWRYEGIAWYAYASGEQPEDAKPVYRFWSDQNRHHFYTISAGEKDSIIADYPEEVWRYEGIAWYGCEEP